MIFKMCLRNSFTPYFCDSSPQAGKIGISSSHFTASAQRNDGRVEEQLIDVGIEDGHRDEDAKCL